MTPQFLELGYCTIDLERSEVSRAGERVALTAHEVALLGLLGRTPGRTVGRDVLLRDALGYREGTRTRALDHAMRRLRAKIEPDPGEPKFLKAVYGQGYRLELPTVARTAESGPVFVGREPELRALEHLLSPQKVVTVLGPGGAGKTRLVGEVARRRSTSWVVDLQDARSAGDVLAATAAALSIPLSPRGREAQVDQMRLVLTRRGPGLLVLDNFEQLVGDSADLPRRWAAEVPGLSVLVASRRRLGVEHAVFDVPPFSSSEAVGLYLLRARVRRAGLSLDAADRDRVERLAQRLDGLPLAIELAASRAHVLGPATLLEQVEQGLDLLRNREAVPGTRQSTMRAALDWSWNLLSSQQRETLVQVSAFSGGFDLEAAQAVVRVEGRVLDLLEDLVECSLLRVDARLGRFRMLGTVREYAWERLGDARSDAVQRHRQHFLSRSAPWTEAARRAGQFADLERERSNLLVAFERAEDPDEAANVLLAVDPLLTTRGPLDRRSEMFERALATPPTDLRLEIKLQWRHADSLRRLGRAQEAEQLICVAAASARTVDDRRLQGIVLGATGAIFLALGRVEDSIQALREAIGIHAEVGNARGEGIARFTLANLLQQLGQEQQSEQMYRDCLRALDRAGDAYVRPAVYSGWGVLHMESGRLDRARELFERALAAKGHEGSGMRLFYRMNLGHLELAAGHLDVASGVLDRVIEDARDAGEQTAVADALHALGLVHAAQGQPILADEAWEQARALYRELGRAPFEGMVEMDQGIGRHRKGQLHEAEAQLRAAQVLLEPTGAGLLARALAHLACVRSDLGAEDAVALVAKALACCPETDAASLAIVQLAECYVQGADPTHVLARVAGVAEWSAQVRTTCALVSARPS